MADEELKKNCRYQPIRHLCYLILDRVFGIATLNMVFSLLVRRLREKDGKCMRSKTLLVALATSSVLAGNVTADYTGLSYSTQNNNDGTWTARIFATFTAETDQLNAVFGDSTDSLLITSTKGFYQNPFGGPTSAGINPVFYDLFPSLLLDSFVTIGLEDQVDNAMLNVGIDWSGFESGGDISTDNGAWFATPADAQVLAGSELRVMIGQFTMYGLDSSISGVLNLQGKVGDFETFQARGQVIYIPSPSAIAIFGLSGIACCRRRK